MKFRAVLLFVASIALTLSATSAAAAPFVYVVTVTQQFGTVDLATGQFNPIGGGLADALSNLVWWKDGTLLTVTAGGTNQPGSLARINPATGEETIIGQTGLGFNAFDLGEVRGHLYLTDFSNNLYAVDPASGVVTPITATGMPPDPTIPLTFNSDGTFNLCDEGLYAVDGELYATFDSFDIDPKLTPPPVAHVHIAPALWRIDPTTGLATFIANTDLQLGALVEVHGRVYAFRGVIDGFDTTFNFPIGHAEVVTLDLASGKTSKITDVDHSVGVIFGAAPVHRP
jgi:hypothetical protein